MIRIINGLKYDTDKMELIAKYTYTYGSYIYMDHFLHAM